MCIGDAAKTRNTARPQSGVLAAHVQTVGCMADGPRGPSVTAVGSLPESVPGHGHVPVSGGRCDPLVGVVRVGLCAAFTSLSIGTQHGTERGYLLRSGCRVVKVARVCVCAGPALAPRWV